MVIIIKRMATFNNSAEANSARAGVLNDLTGGIDPTGHSTLWDGTDFLAWGLNSPYKGSPHAKFRQYNHISISEDIYNSYLSGVQDKYPKGRVKYYENYHNIPASVFQDKSNWPNGSFNYKTGYNIKIWNRSNMVVWSFNFLEKNKIAML